jgi:hypothetical protein
MDISLSDKDIKRFIPGINLITYNALEHTKDINQLLDNPLQACVICYLTKENYGHWCCIFRNKEGIQFFDPYALIPDDELSWDIEKNTRINEHEDYPYLCWLLANSKEPINYNDFKFQSKDKDVTTCGRHVIVRIALKELSCDEYTSVILQLCKKLHMNSDQVVTALTSNI